MSDFTANVNWADGTSNSSNDGTGTVTVVANVNGGFDVIVSHTYQHDVNGALSVQVKDSHGSTTGASAALALTVTPANVTGVSTYLNGYEYSPLNNVVVTTFTSGNGSEPSSNFSATINWGDGTTSNGVVLSAGGNSYEVEGSHSYTDEGHFTVTVSVNHFGASAAVSNIGSTIREQLLPNGTPGTADQRFISELYRDLLGRQVDQQGLDYFLNELYYARIYYFYTYFYGQGMDYYSAGAVANEKAEMAVVQSIQSSAEYKARPQPTGTPQQLVAYDYQLLLDRTPDASSQMYVKELENSVSNDMIMALIIGDSQQEYYKKTSNG